MTRSPSKTTRALSPAVAAFVALGPERLAELLVAAAKADRSLGRSLSLEIAANRGDLGEEIDRQIAQLRTAKGRLDARRATALARELGGLRAMIVDKLGADRPADGLARLLDFLGMAEPVLARRSYEAKVLLETFHAAIGAVGPLMAAISPGPDRQRLALSIYRSYMADDLGLAAPLASVARELLAEERGGLRLQIQEDLAALDHSGAAGRGVRAKREKLGQALSDLADADGDVDAFIAAQKLGGTAKGVEAQAAARLSAAGRHDEALAMLDAATPGPNQSGYALAALRIDVLDALDRKAEAQAARWAQFEAGLSLEMLRAYLKRLPDFEDVEREEAAMDWVQVQARALDALAFLIAWPDLRRAGAFVRARISDLKSDAYEILVPAAEALAARDPIGASLLYRHMISGVLRWKRSPRYPHAARYLNECASLAAAIEDWAGWPTHDVYLLGLRRDYPRSPKFWRRVDG